MILYLLTTFFLYYISQIVYQLFFSKLKDIPGPLISVLFPGYFFILRVLGVMPFIVNQYHELYGPVIRIGWNMVLFSDEKDVNEIYKNYKFSKSELYAVFDPLGNTVFNCRDKAFHLKRKRILLKYLNNHSMKHMEEIVDKKIAKIITKIQNNDSKNELNLIKYLELIALDIIYELSFGCDFNLIESEKYHYLINLINENHNKLMISNILPSFVKPYYDTKSKLLLKTASEIIDISLNSNKNSDSLLNYMIKCNQDGLISKQDIVSEALTQIMAGSGTTINTLIWIFYLILKNDKVYTKLKQEINNNENDNNNYSSIKTNHPYLSAVIYESMRLYPAAGGVPERVVNDDNVHINNIYLPKGTIIGCNIYSLHNLSSKWENSNEFLPERWLVNNEFECNNPNFLPFLKGPRVCIGKNLAMMELYLIIYHLLKHFPMELSDKDLVLSPRFVVLMAPHINNLNINMKDF
ncbi:cytochrome P450 [Neoconidiobolus thromboides FSU 785]|nr:cytochrome P450 [Neoconidiobolus thromboides FSU 785]KAI9296796.1 cytochrome P450 [Neoconidiobolus thromboides FSU 785]